MCVHKMTGMQIAKKRLHIRLQRHLHVRSIPSPQPHAAATRGRGGPRGRGSKGRGRGRGRKSTGRGRVIERRSSSISSNNSTDSAVGMGTGLDIPAPETQDWDVPAPRVEMDVDMSETLLAITEMRKQNITSETPERPVESGISSVGASADRPLELGSVYTSPVKKETEEIKQEVVIKQEPLSPSSRPPVHDTGVVICIDSSDEEDTPTTRTVAPETTVTSLVKTESTLDYISPVKSEPNELDAHTSEDLWGEMVTRSDVFTCHCGRMFLNRRLFECHSSCHSNQPGAITCTPCGKEFPSWFQLEMHFIEAHQDN